MIRIFCDKCSNSIKGSQIEIKINEKGLIAKCLKCGDIKIFAKTINKEEGKA